MRSVQRLLIGVALLSLATGPLSAQLATQAAPKATTPLQKSGKVRPNRPETYGTTAISYLEVPASAFLPWNDAATWTSADFGRGQRWHTAGPGLDFVAPIQLPAGALVVYLELDGNDTNPAAAVYGSFTACAYDADPCSYYPTVGLSNGGDCSVPGFICSGVAAASGSGDLFDTDLSGEGIVIDNFFGQYSLLAETSGATDGSVAIGGMIVGYVLQVSPAPGVATFPDVPTTDFGFQYVEALVSSGITGGCGGGLYCPDNPVTRRQMAIFIAKALGLQWN
jgi:hypothetical protein